MSILLLSIPYWPLFYHESPTKCVVSWLLNGKADAEGQARIPAVSFVRDVDKGSCSNTTCLFHSRGRINRQTLQQRAIYLQNHLPITCLSRRVLVHRLFLVSWSVHSFQHHFVITTHYAIFSLCISRRYIGHCPNYCHAAHCNTQFAHQHSAY